MEITNNIQDVALASKQKLFELMHRNGNSTVVKRLVNSNFNVPSNLHREFNVQALVWWYEFKEIVFIIRNVLFGTRFLFFVSLNKSPSLSIIIGGRQDFSILAAISNRC